MADGFGGGVNATNPYLLGPYGPVNREVEGRDLPVEGEIPAGLEGLYVRNGPNPTSAPTGLHHWFDGEGMLHAIWFENGKARYRNAWPRGSDFANANAKGIFHPADRTQPANRVYKDTANTDVIFHNGKLLALWYISGTPVAVDPHTLSTIGDETFSGQLPRAMSAHSKVDPRTGELVFFDYPLYEPWMSTGAISATGELTWFTQIELKGPRLPHDMGLTEKHVILMDLPIVFTDTAVRKGMWNIHWNDQPTRFAILPRGARGDQVRWFETPACYIYHVINAWDDGDAVVMTACKMVPNGLAPNPAYGAAAAMANVLALHAVPVRWRFDLKTGAVSETQLDDRIGEFPAVNLDLTGAKTRYGYLVSMAPGDLQKFDGLLKYDLLTSACQQHRFPHGVFGSEPAFAPRPNSKTEDDGWVVTFVTDETNGASYCYVIDASDFSASPVAKIALPQRVPAGFHATWVKIDQLTA